MYVLKIQSAPRSLSSMEMIDPHEEVGYLYLHSTDIFLRCPAGDHIEKPTAKWMNVSIIDTETTPHRSYKKQKRSNGDVSHGSNQTVTSEIQLQEMTDSRMLGEPSPQDYVILTWNSSPTNSLTLLSSDIPSFDGTLHDMRRRGTREEDEGLARSDAALLLGTVHVSCCTGYARIETIQIHIHPWKQPKIQQSLHKVLADIVITISIPLLEQYSRLERRKLRNDLDGVSQTNETNALDETFQTNVHKLPLCRTEATVHASSIVSIVDDDTLKLSHSRIENGRSSPSRFIPFDPVRPGSSAVDKEGTSPTESNGIYLDGREPSYSVRLCDNLSVSSSTNDTIEHTDPSIDRLIHTCDEDETTTPSTSLTEYNSTKSPAVSLQRNPKRYTSAQPLPTAVHLLYTILQSDWNALNHIQNEQTEEIKVGPRKESFFPDRLALSQIYQRIHPEKRFRISSSMIHITNQSHPLERLPEDILLHGIAPYLPAKSLYALRSTCKYIHHVLRWSVPGLKLKLYNHQVNTLEWMQIREAKQPFIDDDLYRGINGGSRTRVRSRRSSSIMTVDCYTGMFSIQDTNHTSVGRGGLCCDEPGTGKTITILSLILCSMGQRTSTELTDNATNISNDEIFRIYWNEVLDPSIKSSEILELIKKIKQTNCFRNGESVIRLREICSLAQRGFYDQDFDLFYNQVYSCAPNLIASSSCSEIFSRYKSSCLKRSVKRQNGDIASLVDRKSMHEHLSRLQPSKSTLIIVPKVLLSHWISQIQNNVDTSYFCGSKNPIFFLHGHSLRQSSMFTNLRHTSSSQHDVQTLVDMGSHIPFVFIDVEPTLPLPDECFLSKFMIILSSTQRLSNERKNGTLLIDDDKHSSTVVCPFLKIFFLRLVLDEGHTAGNTTNNASEMCCRILAERRWIVTGTPTPQSVSNNGLKNVLGLLNFINYDFFNPRQGTGVSNWKNITKSFAKGALPAFFQLQSVIQALMSRKMKNSALCLSEPKISNAMIEMSPHEVAMYNTLASAVQRNILVTTMKGKTSAYQDSLLNTLMRAYAQEALNNLRLACFGGARIVPVLKQHDIDRVLSLLHDLHQVDDDRMKMARNFLRRMNTNQTSSCMRCGLNMQTLLLLPCTCFLCTECMTNKTIVCPKCKLSFDVDDFQRLQPGIDFNWSWNVGDESKEEERNLFLALHDQNLLDDNQFRRRRKTAPHICRYSTQFSDGKCLVCGEIHACNFMNEVVCSICHNVLTPCPQEETKATYVIDSILRLIPREENHGLLSIHMRDGYSTTPLRRPLKMIIFSQFRQLLNIIGDRLIRRFGSCCIAEFWGKSKHIELQRFSSNKDCICLLLGKDGANGLDLSFVTHIFFLDHIMDESVRNQVISRAFRIGAYGSVVVEQLIARGTVEELLLNLASSKRENHLVDQNMSERASSQLRYLLTNIKLIRSSIPTLKKNKSKKVWTNKVRFADVGKPIKDEKDIK